MKENHMPVAGPSSSQPHDRPPAPSSRCPTPAPPSPATGEDASSTMHTKKRRNAQREADTPPPDWHLTRPTKKARISTKAHSQTSERATQKKAGSGSRPRRPRAEVERHSVGEEATCGFGGCTTTLACNQRAARAHTRTHYPTAIPQGPFPCIYRADGSEPCRVRPFSDLAGLQRHVESSHWGWAYKCPGCGNTFTRRERFLGHYQKCRAKTDL
ncbi:hypothetical protein C8Q78DRAFT_567566 [Trametes maxima]|nr:hypothetical protein C8Q78DRAFT_567566 [Trametes maxima]